MTYYYIHNGTEQSGPFTIESLKQQNINSKTMVWFEGIEGWSNASDIAELKPIITVLPPPFKIIPPPPLSVTKPIEQDVPRTGVSFHAHTNETIGLFTELEDDERIELENSTISLINFEKGSFFKEYDTCIGKVYLTNKKILILKLIVLKSKSMKIEDTEQFGTAVGQWFDIPLEYLTTITTPKQSMFRSIFKFIIGEKKEGLELHYESPMEVDEKSFFGLGGTKKVKEQFIMVFTIDNKELWNIKIQTIIAKSRKQNNL